MTLEEETKELFLKEINEIATEYGITTDDAMSRWICEHVLDIHDELDIDEACSIGGKNDYCVDIFHHSDSGEQYEQSVAWVQAKFAENLDKVVIREEMTDFGNTIGRLETPPFNANEVFKVKSDEFNSIGGANAPIMKKMYYVVAGTLNDQAKELIESQEWKTNLGVLPGSPDIDFRVLDINDIISLMNNPKTQPLHIKFDGPVLTRTDSVTDKNSVIGFMSATDLVKIVREHKDTLFLENPRQALGSTKPNKAISATLRDDQLKQKFWKLNNGVTAICTDIVEIETNPAKYKVENFKVVNGRQTTYSLERNRGSLDSGNVMVGMTIHQAIDDAERNLISEATNTQNPIKPVDLMTNTEELKNMVTQCKRDYPNFFFERQTNAFASRTSQFKTRITRRRCMKKITITRAYMAYAMDPNRALFLQDKDLYNLDAPENFNQVYQDRNIKELIIPHILFEIITSLHKRWSDEVRQTPPVLVHSRDKSIIAKKIVRNYLLYFIGETMNGLENQDRMNVENKLIEIFGNLTSGDNIPNECLQIVETAFTQFMMCFNMNQQHTWPEKLLERIQEQAHANEVPTGAEIMGRLKSSGATILPILLRQKTMNIQALNVDVIKDKLMILLSETPEESTNVP